MRLKPIEIDDAEVKKYREIFRKAVNSCGDLEEQQVYEMLMGLFQVAALAATCADTGDPDDVDDRRLLLLMHNVDQVAGNMIEHVFKRISEIMRDDKPFDAGRN